VVGLVRVFLFFSIVLINFVYVQAAPIPLAHNGQVASDLTYQGRLLLPDQAKKLYDSKKIQNLSLLDPDDTSILWKNRLPEPYDSVVDTIGIENTDEAYDFLSYSTAPIGCFGFSITKTLPNGTTKTYRIRLDIKNHNILLRRTLLRKLGYNIAPISYAKKITVKFKGDFSKDEFIKQLKRSTFLEEGRWVVSSTEGKLVLQDAIVFEGAEDSFYNLARGSMSQSVIQNRRLLNALLIPYNLLDVTESVNIFSWYPGKVINDGLLLPFADESEFSTSYEDARWITRRLLKLTRKDFEDVVFSAQYPEEVSHLLIEKIIARRNFLRKILNLEIESKEIPVDTDISFGTNLINGKLKLIDWPGYAAHFAYGDPESPINGEELSHFFKSKAISNVISNLVLQFNANIVPHTDMAWKMYDHQIDVAVHQFADFIRTGQIKKVPFGFWNTPFYNGNLIAAREVITGSYLGTDNLVQLADTFGYSLDAGFYFGADGLPAKMGFGNRSRVHINRTYTHVKPIRSIKVALKEPFQNMLVNNLMKNNGRILDTALRLDETALQTPEGQSQLKETVQKFKEALGVGESIIITTSLGGDTNLNLSYSLTQRLHAQAGLFANKMILSRLHIFRKNENTIQIYRDPAKMLTKGLYIDLSLYVPVLGFNFAKADGDAATHFYSLNIDSDLDKNPDVLQNLKGLRRVLVEGRTDLLSVLQRPYKISHDFTQKRTDSHFFMWQKTKLESEDVVQIVHPTGASKDFVRYVAGKRSGKNYEDLTINIINSLLREYSEQDLVVASTQGNGDPGETFMGQSVSKLIAIEGELQPGQKTRRLVDPFVNISLKWKNWSIGKIRVEQVLQEISKKFDYDFYDKNVLQGIGKLQLSSIDVNMSIYEDGIRTLALHEDKEIEELFRKSGFFPELPERTRSIRESAYVRNIEKLRQRNEFLIRRIVGYFHDYKVSMVNGDGEKSLELLNKFFNYADQMLTIKQVISLVGGKDNIFVYSSIRGFRVGDEREDDGIYSNSLGEIGSRKSSGPLRDLQQKIGVLDGEFFIYWLVNQIL